MSHHIYHTEAIILSQKPSGEAGKYIFCLTKELGLVMAKAEGIRLLKSKLRFGLQDYCLSDISLVRGKEIWRLTGAKLVENYYQLLGEKKDRVILIARVFGLLLRLLHGEEKNDKLFELIKGYLKFLEGDVTDNNLRLSEILVVLRVLRVLGYFAETGQLEELAESDTWNSHDFEMLEKEKKLALIMINTALKETQL